ncbi:MAG: GntR family transcriptional regulator [Rhodospirillaceae bacterium]|nr:GntR family transcriptional regulator [Rhodospirillaceae bacterium]
MKDDQLAAREPVATSEKVLERIGHSILSGEFEPGERLTETDLAQRFGVSRSPLREALLRLEERQLIERVPFSGMRVVSLDDRTVDELYEIRGALEGLACRRAAAVITPEQIAELRGVLAQRSRALKSTRGDARQQPTIQDFHILIARISGNRELERMLAGDIWHYMRAQYRRWARARERMDLGHAEHLRIVDALEARDGELAEILMRRHIVASRQELVDAKARAEARGAA